MTFNNPEILSWHNLAGNRKVPEPREGYEQRKVNHNKYAIASAKGWEKRLVDGRPVMDNYWILCEREIEN